MTNTMPQKIIAILGLPGSGKTVTIDFLMEKYHWPKVYFGQVTFDEMAKRGLEINEQNERAVREDLRANFGLLHYCKEIIKKIEAAPDEPVILVESLYSWEEYLYFKEHFGDRFKTIAIYVSPETRYERLAVRPIRPLTAEVAQGRDYAQITNISQAGPIAMANHTINNEADLESLYRSVDETISKIIG
jgi:dephospho-CoA kinase